MRRPESFLKSEEIIKVCLEDLRLQTWLKGRACKREYNGSVLGGRVTKTLNVLHCPAPPTLLSNILPRRPSQRSQYCMKSIH